MKKLILERLREIEQEKNIKIIYACESGSRAWGFASPNSDWDVRFIYVHPKDWYLSINEKKDTINLDIDANELDFSAWELRKFLRLMNNSNATTFEWLQSPIIYSNNNSFRANLWEIGQEYFKPRSMAFHYLGQARKSLKKGMVDGKMNIKKYFYVLRPLLAARWICDKGSVPPMEFAPLLEQLNERTELYEAIKKLTEEKIKAQEGDFVKPIECIQNYINKEINLCGTKAKDLLAENADIVPIDNFFRRTLKQNANDTRSKG